MSALLDKRLHKWIEKHKKPNPHDYLFVNQRGLPFRSDKVVAQVHKTMDRLGLARPEKGVHVGIHCFRHGVTTELLQSGTPIQLVRRMMRHGDAKVTLKPLRARGR